MRKYKIEIKLLFEYHDISSSETIKQKKYNYESFNFEEPENNIKITFKPDFVIQFENILCQNLDEAYCIINKLLSEICEILTLIIQIEIQDSDQYQPYLSYNISDAKILDESFCEKQLAFKMGSDNIMSAIEYFGIRESLALFITYELSIKLFPLLFDSSRSNTTVSYFMDILYRAMRCRDIESKYFTLFTMIEYIENKYRDAIVVNKIFNETQTNALLEKAAELLCEKDQKIQNRIQNRLNQLLSDATIETRAEKLCEIIKTKYAMETISYVDINFDIKPKKMQQFIDLRNHFFHGAKSNDADRNAVATNELLRLCMAIFQKEVENA